MSDRTSPGSAAAAAPHSGALRTGASTAAAVLPLGREHRLLVTAAVMLASGMQAADATIANVALPELVEDLGGGFVLGAWVVTSYLCATAVLAPLTGMLRRRFGARTLFTGAVGLFAIASLLCSLAPSALTLVLFRILQGAAGGVIHPLAQATLLDLYPRRQHGRILAAWGAAVMVGPVAGPMLGGIITDLTSWRLVFAVNLPLSAAAIWAMLQGLRETEARTDLPIDMLGVGLLAMSVGALQLLLTHHAGRLFLGSSELLAESATAVVAVTALVLRSRRVGLAVFRPAVFRDLNFATASFYNFTGSALLFAVIVLVPALGQGPLEYSATVAGLSLVPRGIATMLTILMAGQLIDRADGRILLAAAIAAMAGGLVILSEARPPEALVPIVIGSTLQAAGGGMLLTCLSTIGFSTLRPELRTDAAGIYSLLRQLGCASGVAVVTAVLDARVEAGLAGLRDGLDSTSAGDPPLFLQIASLRAYSACFWEMAVVAALILPGVLLFRAGSRRHPVKSRPG